jgi:hypothetical protein
MVKLGRFGQIANIGVDNHLLLFSFPSSFRLYPQEPLKRVVFEG